MEDHKVGAPLCETGSEPPQRPGGGRMRRDVAWHGPPAANLQRGNDVQHRNVAVIVTQKSQATMACA